MVTLDTITKYLRMVLFYGSGVLLLFISGCIERQAVDNGCDILGNVIDDPQKMRVVEAWVEEVLEDPNFLKERVSNGVYFFNRHIGDHSLDIGLPKQVATYEIIGRNLGSDVDAVAIGLGRRYQIIFEIGELNLSPSMKPYLQHKGEGLYLLCRD